MRQRRLGEKPNRKSGTAGMPGSTRTPILVSARWAVTQWVQRKQRKKKRKEKIGNPTQGPSGNLQLSGWVKNDVAFPGDRGHSRQHMRRKGLAVLEAMDLQGPQIVICFHQCPEGGIIKHRKNCQPKRNRPARCFHPAKKEKDPLLLIKKGRTARD